MGEYDPHSLILACDFRADDVDRMGKWRTKHRDGLAAIGGPMRDVLMSRAIFEWFDISGVADIPPIFGGEVVEKV
jgi:hypothetical protein